MGTRKTTICPQGEVHIHAAAGIHVHGKIHANSLVLNGVEQSRETDELSAEDYGVIHYLTVEIAKVRRALQKLAIRYHPFLGSPQECRVCHAKLCVQRGTLEHKPDCVAFPQPQLTDDAKEV